MGCFENENPKDGKQKIEHTASASRLFAAAWRCAHLCASGEAGAWPESVIAGLVGHAKRFLTYGVGASQGDQQEETENAPAGNPAIRAQGQCGVDMTTHIWGESHNCCSLKRTHSTDVIMF